jgi:hypothetical protein
VQFKVGEAIVLCNLDAEVIAMGLITGVGGQGCVHHGVEIKESWFRVQLGEVVSGKGNTSLLVPNENDDPPQSLLHIVPFCEGPNEKPEGFAKQKQSAIFAMQHASQLVVHHPSLIYNVPLIIAALLRHIRQTKLCDPLSLCPP